MQWVCSCGFSNKATNLVCGGTGPMGCKSPKPSARGAAAGLFAANGPSGFGAKGRGKGAVVAASSPYGSKGGEWQCEVCGFGNKAANTQCGGTGPLGCKAPKPGSEGQFSLPAQDSSSYGPQRRQKTGLASATPYQKIPAAFASASAGKGGAKPGEWTCRCGFSNKATNEVCGGNGPMGCKSPKEWMCGACGFMNKALNTVCGGTGTMGCKTPRAADPLEMMAALMGLSPPSTAMPQRSQNWDCAACGFKNKAMNEVCGGNGPMGCKQPRPQDWVCACGFKNKFSNDVCGGTGAMGCKAARP